jgi:hypothetical protein
MSALRKVAIWLAASAAGWALIIAAGYALMAGARFMWGAAA